MRYRLRTLLLLLAVLPPLLAVVVPPLLQRFAQKPLPAPTPLAKPLPYFAVYATGNADPNITLQTLATLLAGTPDARMSLDPKSGQLAVLGPPSVHATVARVVGALQAGSPLPSLKRPRDVPQLLELPPLQVPNEL